MRASTCKPTMTCASALLMVLASLTNAQSAEQSAEKNSTNTRWSTLAALPNFTEGVWGYTFSPAATQQAGLSGSLPELKPGVSRNANVATGETCTPIGVPTVMAKPYPFEFVFEPDRILMLMEFDGLIRRIWTDGRTHPEDPDLTYAGHSIGHWQDRTLVVDTVGLLPEVAIAPGIAATANTRIEERITLTGPDTLTIETTVSSPDSLAKPWTYTRTYDRHRDWEVQEYFCQQNPE